MGQAKRRGSLEERIKDVNERLGSNITYRVAKDEMWQKYCVEFMDEDGEVFFKKGEENSMVDSDLWNYETAMIVENRYKEIYQNKALN